MTEPTPDRAKAAEVLLHAVLGTTDGDLVLDGDLPASEVARLIQEEAAPAIVAALAAERAAAVADLRARVKAVPTYALKDDDQLIGYVLIPDDVLNALATGDPA